MILKTDRISLTSAELNALRTSLRHGETPLEFITSAINSEIARREGRPRRGMKAVQIMKAPRGEARHELREVEIIVSHQPAE
ncbi:hypothetical protein DK427_20175 [Methylobacterium radiodurans]|uniref:Uncharacterized protein n=1 Tax=Methylobacterium radiodurans TaxID=2202828 RepID=A0A2U8VWF9_9HYPH|nr:hypothetical protein DK427_20175 [Methylobacterium radiodurans]